MKSHLEAIMKQAVQHVPAKITWQEIKEQSSQYLRYTQDIFPQYLSELHGIADGAGIDFEVLFAVMCEELWDPHVWDIEGFRTGKGCTDLAARGRATKDGSTLLAHTNDELPDHENHLVILKVQAEDDPEYLGVSSGGAAITAGFNAAGIGLTGNQVYPNDCKPGVPRQLMVRAIMGARRLGKALEICVLPERASNYNNIVADASGEIFSMEGSATDIEAIYIKDDILAHANHYVSPQMREYEADRSEITNSLIRHHRASRRLREMYGQIDVNSMMEIIQDHTNYPASICMHGINYQTAYSMVIQLNELRCWIGKGRPCETQYFEYSLSPYDGERG
jgi:isopenicillin-N N-acyltransferase-like protein